MKKYSITHRLVFQALIAALYAAMTYLLPAFSYGPIQFRISEILALLAFFHPDFVIGLTVGCALSNLASPFGLVDVVVGSFHTFIATYCMTKVKDIRIAALFPALFSFIIGLEIMLLSSEPVNFFLVTGQIMLSEWVIVFLIGIPFFKLLEKHSGLRHLQNGSHS